MLKKENTTQVLSCEYCKIFKNSFFIEHLRLLLLLMYFRRNIEKPRICFQICNFTKKRLQHKYFLVNIEKFLRTSILKKKTTTQVFSCEFCEIFKKSFFIEHLRWLLLMHFRWKVEKPRTCLQDYNIKRGSYTVFLWILRNF